MQISLRDLYYRDQYGGDCWVEMVQILEMDEEDGLRGGFRPVVLLLLQVGRVFKILIGFNKTF